MADSVWVRIDGLRELGEKLKALGDDVSGPIAISATGAAAGIIKKQAQANVRVAAAPVKIEDVIVNPGNLKANIIVKRIKKADTNLTSEHIVTVRGKKRYGYASRYGSMLEYGTVKMPAYSFLRPAFDQEKGWAVKAMLDRIKKRIDKANQS